MATITSIMSGQWNGYYEYDNSYYVAVRKVTFKMVLEDLGEGTFKGKCIDMEGDTGIATIEGFMEDSFISFAKEYAFFELDENGSRLKCNRPLNPH